MGAKRDAKKGRELAIVEPELPTRIIVNVRELSQMALGLILIRVDSLLFALIRVSNSGFKPAPGLVGMRCARPTFRVCGNRRPSERVRRPCSSLQRDGREMEKDAAGGGALDEMRCAGAARQRWDEGFHGRAQRVPTSPEVSCPSMGYRGKEPKLSNANIHECPRTLTNDAGFDSTSC